MYEFLFALCHIDNVVKVQVLHHRIRNAISWIIFHEVATYTTQIHKEAAWAISYFIRIGNAISNPVFNSCKTDYERSTAWKLHREYGQKVQFIGHVSKINALFKIRHTVEHYFVEAQTRRPLFHVIPFTILIHDSIFQIQFLFAPERFVRNRYIAHSWNPSPIDAFCHPPSFRFEPLEWELLNNLLPP